MTRLLPWKYFAQRRYSRKTSMREVSKEKQKNSKNFIFSSDFFVQNTDVFFEQTLILCNPFSTEIFSFKAFLANKILFFFYSGNSSDVKIFSFYFFQVFLFIFRSSDFITKRWNITAEKSSKVIKSDLVNSVVNKNYSR